MTTLLVLGGIVAVCGGGAVAQSWVRTKDWCPEWLKRNRKGG
jgi:hypothetical protein